MAEFSFNGIKVFLYETPGDFANCEHYPLGKIPEHFWEKYYGIKGGKCITFCVANPDEIHVFMEKDCETLDLFRNISHELGHLVTGGFSDNPPEARFFKGLHEKKAEHYAIFVDNCMRLTQKILQHYGKDFTITL